MARSDAIISIAINDIIAQASRRAINRAVVHDLAGSIREIGLQTPIMVRNIEGEELYVLVSGGHRIEAYRQLGIERIPARIVEFDDLRAELWEIDENLCRAELSAADRAEQTDRRKKIFERIHGKATENRARVAADARWEDDNAKRKLCAKHTFEADTAKATGKSKRAVQLDAERGEKISPEAMGLIKGTFLDKGTYLDALKKLSPAEQLTKVRADLLAPIPERRSKNSKPPAPPEISATDCKGDEVVPPEQNAPAAAQSPVQPLPQSAELVEALRAYRALDDTDRSAFLAEIGATLSPSKQ